MATPIFDGEIVRLRRVLGDVYNPDGTIITIGNVGASPETGEAFKRDELVDIYNKSVHAFLDYLTGNIKREDWYRFVPGYLKRTTGVMPSAGKVSLDYVYPKILEVVEVFDNMMSKVVHPKSPDKWYSYKQSSFIEVYYTVIGDAILLSSSLTSVDIIYLQEHVNVVHGGLTDLPRITGKGLDRILLFAEREARGHKSPDSSELPELQISVKQQGDVIRETR